MINRLRRLIEREDRTVDLGKVLTPEDEVFKFEIPEELKPKFFHSLEGYRKSNFILVMGLTPEYHQAVARFERALAQFERAQEDRGNETT